jgi:hypothetical protein
MEKTFKENFLLVFILLLKEFGEQKAKKILHDLLAETLKEDTKNASTGCNPKEAKLTINKNITEERKMSKLILVDFKKETGIEVTKDRLVNARDIYEKLFLTNNEKFSLKKGKSDKNIFKHFQQWANNNIIDKTFEDKKTFYFQEGKDYTKVELKTKGRPQTNYLLTQRTAEMIIAKSDTQLGKFILDRLFDLFHNLESQKEVRRTSVFNFYPLADAIKTEKNGEDKHYHYSNEFNLINQVVTGLTAKQFKAKYGVDNVRDHLTKKELVLLNDLQIMDTGFIKMGFSFKMRKLLLMAHKEGNAQNVLQAQMLKLAKTQAS